MHVHFQHSLCNKSLTVFRTTVLSNITKGRKIMSEKLVEAMVNMKEKEALEITEQLIEDGEDPMNILNACKDAMTVVGERFEKGEFFLPELVMAGEMLSQISAIVKPKITGSTETEHLGKVIIGTVEGDIHDIGKDIVVFMLDVNGFEVLDLGIDVPIQKFVDAIKDFKPAVACLAELASIHDRGLNVRMASLFCQEPVPSPGEAAAGGVEPCRIEPARGWERDLTLPVRRTPGGQPFGDELRLLRHVSGQVIRHPDDSVGDIEVVATASEHEHGADAVLCAQRADTVHERGDRLSVGGHQRLHPAVADHEVGGGRVLVHEEEA